MDQIIILKRVNPWYIWCNNKLLLSEYTANILLVIIPVLTKAPWKENYVCNLNIILQENIQSILKFKSHIQMYILDMKDFINIVVVTKWGNASVHSLAPCTRLRERLRCSDAYN